MHTRISKISLIVFCVLLLLSGFLLSVPGKYWPWFAIMAALALVPCAVGPRWYRFAGFCALSLAIALIVWDCKSGQEYRQRFRRRLERLRNQPAQLPSTNGQPDGAANRGRPVRSE